MTFRLTPAAARELGVKLRPMARTKYRAVRTTVDGIVFDSAKEARRYRELICLWKAHEISGLNRQQPFELHVTGCDGRRVTLGKYVADFTYFDVHGELFVEDVKGFKTPLYRWKKKHVEAEYGVVIQET